MNHKIKLYFGTSTWIGKVMIYFKTWVNFLGDWIPILIQNWQPSNENYDPPEMQTYSLRHKMFTKNFLSIANKKGYSCIADNIAMISMWFGEQRVMWRVDDWPQINIFTLISRGQRHD